MIDGSEDKHPYPVTLHPGHQHDRRNAYLPLLAGQTSCAARPVHQEHAGLLRKARHRADRLLDHLGRTEQPCADLSPPMGEPGRARNQMERLSGRSRVDRKTGRKRSDASDRGAHREPLSDADQLFGPALNGAVFGARPAPGTHGSWASSAGATWAGGSRGASAMQASRGRAWAPHRSARGQGGRERPPAGEGAEGGPASSRAGHTTKLLNNFLNAGALAATADVRVAGKKAGLDLHVLPDVLNSSSSGVNFATLNRFPKIVDGDYLEGGPTSKRMTKALVPYIALVRGLGVASLNASGPLASSRRRCHRRHVGWHPIGGCKRPQNRSDAMKVFQGRAGTVSERRSATFSGVVWADPMMPTIDKVTVNRVCFTPGARSFWHTHEQGQFLQVTSGSGFVCLDGEAPQTSRTGDAVWIGANERHWHGAGSDTLMVHTATSLGTTHWAEEVLEEVYRKAAGTGSPRLL